MPVDSLTEAYQDRARDWKLCRDCKSGPRTVKDAGMAYLPKPGGMSDPDYHDYVVRADFFNGFSRAIQGMHGMVFRNDTEFDWPSSLAEDLTEDVTNSGQSADALARWLMHELLVVGRIGFLVDRNTLPEVSGKVVQLTKAEAARENLRPFVVRYLAEDILEARFGKVNNRTKLVMVRLHETFSEPLADDPYIMVVRDRWRVLELIEGEYWQSTWVRDENDRRGSSSSAVKFRSESRLQPLWNGKPLDHIPFHLCDADGEAETPEIPPPPMLDIAEKTVSLYRTLADLEHCNFFSGFPQPYVKLSARPMDAAGMTYEPTFRIGGNSAWIIYDANGEVGMLSHQGGGSASLEKAVAAKKQDMAILGVRMLEPQRPMVEAFGTAMVHRQGEISVLQALALRASQTLSAALTEMAQWAGVEGEVVAKLNTDFIPAEPEAAQLKAMLEAFIAGKLPGEDWWAYLQRGELVAASKTWDQAKTQIEDEEPELPPMPAPLALVPGTGGARPEEDEYGAGVAKPKPKPEPKREGTR